MKNLNLKMTACAFAAAALLTACGGGGTTPAADNPSVPPSQTPTTAANAPTASSVVSIYSDASGYVPLTGSWTYRASWSSASLSEEAVAGNNVLKYSNLDFVGIEPPTGTTLNATSASHFNVDVWTADATEFKVKLVDYGSNASYGGGDDTEHQITVAIDTTEQRTWKRITIPLTDFTNLTARANIGQIIFVGSPTGAVTTFVDNVFFSNN